MPLWVSLLLLMALSSQGTEEDSIRSQIVASERAELDCLKRGDLTTFASLLAGEAMFVDAHGLAGEAEVVQHTAGVRRTDYS